MSGIQRMAAALGMLSLANCSRLGGSAMLPGSLSNGTSTVRARQESAVFTHLFSFDGKNGKTPVANLTYSGGMLFGTTYGGGAGDGGTAFKSTIGGTQHVLHSFAGGTDGVLPEAPLLALGNILYGTTINGGGSGDEGTIFRVTTDGVERVLYRFTGRRDGANPYAGLTELDGTIYGTTAGGGEHSEGTVFKVSTSGKESVIYSFGATYRDGQTPIARLLPRSGALYGTTYYGGSGCSSFGCGTVFKVTTSGAETVVYRFKGGTDGAAPSAALINLAGTLYGTTRRGGQYNNGTVFKVSAAGKEIVLYRFKGGTDGAGPLGMTAVNGALYGTTSAGGTSHDGTIFEVTTSGRETVLHTFKGDGDGTMPQAGLRDVNGTLYGTTAAGGASNDGTIFSLKP
ncbi:MAG: choice-of-anchor tandem repeat GloVer-containing protein [Candidatus Cybelea sp.]